MKNLLFFSVNTQFENLGDALINREMIRLAVSKGDVFLDISRMPESFKETINISNNKNVFEINGFLRLLIKMFISSIIYRKPTYYFLCPGGNSHDIQGKAILISNIKLVVFWLMKKAGIKICHIGVSFESLGSNFFTFLRRRNKYLHRFYVRDKASAELLQKNGIVVDGIMPDLAFNLFENVEIKNNKINKVCFNFRTDQYDEQLSIIKNRIKEIIKILPPETDYILSAQVHRDISGAESIKLWMKNDLNIEVELYFNNDNIEILQDFYANCDLIVSNRLHSLLLAASVGTNTVPLVNVHTTKVIGLYDTANSSASLLDQDSPITKGKLEFAINNRLQGKSQYTLLQQKYSDIFDF